MKVAIQAVPDLAVSRPLQACPEESDDRLENDWWERKCTFVKGFGPRLDELSKLLEHEGIGDKSC